MLIWKRELDIYGKVRFLKGEEDFIPFRYQGQYYDKETKLCYNCFRYNSPKTGLYISQDSIELAGNNPNFYAYVFDSNIQVDVFGLSPTDPIDRAFLKEILGEHKNKGGAYMFRVLKEGKEKWYVGKANNLYRRLLQHLQKVKLESKFLESINVIVIINGVVKYFFKTEADVIKEFGGIKNLANEINSPICKT